VLKYPQKARKTRRFALLLTFYQQISKLRWLVILVKSSLFLFISFLNDLQLLGLSCFKE